MDVADWRKKIDDVDRKLVEMLNERARFAREIGFLKRGAQAPITDPLREQEVLANVRRNNRGPLPEHDLLNLYERILDIMRKFEREQSAGHSQAARQAAGSEIEAETNE